MRRELCSVAGAELSLSNLVCSALSKERRTGGEDCRSCILCLDIKYLLCLLRGNSEQYELDSLKYTSNRRAEEKVSEMEILS